MPLPMEILIDNHIIKFRSGGVSVSGDIYASGGDVIQFESAYAFAIFIKGFAPREGRRAYAVRSRLRTRVSPVQGGGVVFESKWQNGRYRRTLPLKPAPQLGHYYYGVAALEAMEIRTKDPQIIIN
jgi:hypothetical protein